MDANLPELRRGGGALLGERAYDFVIGRRGVTRWTNPNPVEVGSI